VFIGFDSYNTTSDTHNLCHNFVPVKEVFMSIDNQLSLRDMLLSEAPQEQERQMKEKSA